MHSLTARRLLLLVSGGIAAYKAPDVVRRLRDAGAEVRVVMTPAATRFVTPLTLQAVSGHDVRVELFDSAAEAAMGDEGRVLVRASGTEPLLRVMVEASTQEQVDHWTDHLGDLADQLLNA